MPKFRITPSAREDLINIGRYTEQHWGKTQRNAYLNCLNKRFEWLATNSKLGKHRTEIAEDYYSYPQGEHVIFYVASQTGIDIIGIPHKEMDIITYFQPD